MGGRFDLKQVAADIFGNAIANSLVHLATAAPKSLLLPSSRVSDEHPPASAVGVESTGQDEGLSLASGIDFDPPTDKEMNKLYGPKAKLLKDVLNDATQTIYDAKGKLVLDPDLESYLTSLTYTQVDIDAERARLTQLAKDGKLKAFYDFDYFSKENATDPAKRFDQSMTSIGDDRRAIDLVLAHHNIELSDSNAALLSDKVFEKVPVVFPKELKKAFKAAARDLAGFARTRDKFLGGLTLASLGVGALENYSATHIANVGFDKAVGEMRAAISSGYFTLRPFTSISNPLQTNFMQQYNDGGQSEILIYKEGFKWDPRQMAIGLMHELMHAPSVQNTLYRIVNAPGKKSRGQLYNPDPKTFYDRANDNKYLLRHTGVHGQALGKGQTAANTGNTADNYDKAIYEGAINNWYPREILRKLKLIK